MSIFLIGALLANAWSLVILARVFAGKWRPRFALLGAGWAVFVAVGWLGVSVEVMTRLILPRTRDVDAPVRLAQAFQRSFDQAVFAGQPRLYVPHPNLDTVKSVLSDARLQGHLPPSLQPDRPVGPLSRLVRFVFRRADASQS